MGCVHVQLSRTLRRRPAAAGPGGRSAPGPRAGAWCPVASPGQAGVLRGPPGQACRSALGPRDPPSFSALRPAASRLRSRRAGRPAEARGRRRPGRATDALSSASGAFHTFPQPGTAPGSKGVRRGGAFVP